MKEIKTTEVPTLITKENSEKEFSKKDIDKLLDNVSNGYASLAELFVARLEVLETISPVIDKALLEELETKCSGLTINMQKLEEDLFQLKDSSDEIEKLLVEKETADEDRLKQIELTLLPKFGDLVVKTGDIHKGLDSLSEYYFVKIQAVVDSLQSNVIKKHNELSELAKQTEETKVLDTEAEKDNTVN